MAGVGLGASLAEAYVMRSIYKEKMKKMEKQKAVTAGDVGAEREMKASSGCFFWASKTRKTHSAKVFSAESDRKLQQAVTKYEK